MSKELLTKLLSTYISQVDVANVAHIFPTSAPYTKLKVLEVKKWSNGT